MKYTFTGEWRGKERTWAVPAWTIFIWFGVLFILFGALWFGVLSHLHGWGYVLGALALLERVLRLVKLHYKVNGKYWLDM